MKNINSLKNTPGFKKVYSEGKSRADRRLVVYVLCGQEETRLGIACGRKVGGSVIRHRVTRLIRESWQMYKSKIPNGCHIVVVARKDSAGCDLSDISESFEHLMKAHKII